MAFKLKYFSNNGLIVHHPNPEVGHYTPPGRGSGLGDRRPVLYKPSTRDVFVGEPGWYHGDTYRHYGLSQFGEDWMPVHEGFFNGDMEWGNGSLSWYNQPTDEEHAAVKDALINAGHEIHDPPPEDVEDEEDWT